jgi:D-amino peptidase
MKIYIVQDGEGVAGVTQWAAKMKPERLHEANVLMTKEVNAAVEGALEAGAGEVYVQESHPFVLEMLHDEIKLVQGGDAIDETFDAQFFVGQHAMSMTEDGILAHTFCHAGVRQMILNGQPIGEFGWRNIFAASMGVPTVFISGDEAACREAKNMQKNIVTAPVKKGLGLHSGISLSPAKARALIREKAAEAVRKTIAGEFKVSCPPGPYELIMEYYNQLVAEKALSHAGVERLDTTTIKYCADNFESMFKFRKFSASIHGIGF